MFRDVLAIAYVMVIEVYQEIGVKFEDAIEELESKIVDPVERKPKVIDNEASMAQLMAMMGGSDFKGKRP